MGLARHLAIVLTATPRRFSQKTNRRLQASNFQAELARGSTRKEENDAVSGGGICEAQFRVGNLFRRENGAGTKYFIRDYRDVIYFFFVYYGRLKKITYYLRRRHNADPPVQMIREGFKNSWLLASDSIGIPVVCHEFGNRLLPPPEWGGGSFRELFPASLSLSLSARGGRHHSGPFERNEIGY